MIFKRIIEDLDAFLARDPAARSRLEVAFLYPGFHALMAHRVANRLWRNRWRYLARFVSQLSRLLTGVEIHPGATIGKRFVIDHGAGIVIGETAEIGDDVTLYQNVTLGGVAPSVDSHEQRNTKRHPTLADGVIVGSGGQVLGPYMVGEGARIGANAVVTRDIPAGVTAVGIPARVVMPKDKAKAKEFQAYGTPADGCPDPVLRTIDNLRAQVTALTERLEALEGGRPAVDEETGAAAEETPVPLKKEKSQ
jgi:serine O-acetyltransferase